MKKHRLYKRYEVMIDYPEPESAEIGYFSKGDIITCDQAQLTYEKYPAIFRLLKWFERCSLGDLLDVKFIEVVEYVGYDLVGDVLKVTGYDMEGLNTPNPKLISYKVGDRAYAIHKVAPALEEQRTR